MTADQVMLGIMAANFAISVGAMVVAYLGRRHGVTDALERRVSALEERLGNVPGQAEIHAIQLQLATIGGDLRVMAQSMTGQGEILRRVESVVSRHEDHLLGNGGRK